MHLALAGGTGGAKLAFGLARGLAPDDLLVVVNTGDDFSHLGLRVCPDLDTVMYTLAGIADPETGWGIRGETWRFMERVSAEGGETWFRIGDRDLETHRRRTAALAAGEPLSGITARLRRDLGIRHRIAPATDDDAGTLVLTEDGPLPFQEYFVREACRPRATGFAFPGAEKAVPSPPVAEALGGGAVESLVVCPSNPFVSIGPILAVPAIRRALEARAFPVVAVSPIVGGRAIRGPAAKMMRELGLPATAAAVARHYRGLVDGMVVDEADAGLAPEIEAAGQAVLATRTVMAADAERERLAAEALAFAAGLRPRPEPAAAGQPRL